MDLKGIQQLQTDLNALFELMGLSFVKPEIEIADTETLHVELVVPEGEEREKGLGLIIGSHGDTLAALEFIVALMVNKGREKWLRVKVDVDGYRRKREDDLRGLAIRMADKAKFFHEPVALRPMSANDRRVVHTVLGEIAGIKTASEGEGRDRHIVITAV